MRRTVTVIAAVVALVAVATGATERQADPASGVQKEISTKERALYDAAAKHDQRTFEALVAPDGVWATSSGFVPMGMLAEQLSAFTLAKVGVENLRVTQLDANSALAIYVRTAEGRFQDEPVKPNALASTVWIRRDGTWRALHHQETDLTK